jgi:hypothetical protein
VEVQLQAIANFLLPDNAVVHSLLSARSGSGAGSYMLTGSSALLATTDSQRIRRVGRLTGLERYLRAYGSSSPDRSL